MASIEFYPVDIEYRIANNKAAIYIYGSTKEGEKVCVVDEDFRPYFYIALKVGVDSESFLMKISAFEIEVKGEKAFITGREFADKKLLGKPITLLKVFANLPNLVPALREAVKSMKEVENVYEADIPFVRRYLIDKGIFPMTLTAAEGEFIKSHSRVPVFMAEKISQSSEDSLAEPRILSIDIETYNPSNAIEMEKNPILMIAFYGKNFRKVITWQRFRKTEDFIEFADNEAELLEKTREVINEFKPDIITGYFSDTFDWPYIKTRAEKNRVKLDMGADFSLLKTSLRSEATEISGISNLDIYKFIKRVVSRKLKTESNKLNDVATEILGEGKSKEVMVENLASDWDSGKHLELYCKYNLQDAKITYDLASHLLPNIIELVKIVGLPVSDVIGMGFSQLVEWYLLRREKEFDEIAPNKPEHGEMRRRLMQTYEGAFVYEPTPGLYHNIAIFDFRSLYPSIIASHNISPMTFECEHEQCRENPAPVEKANYWFCKKKKGFIPKIIEDLIKRRMRVKEIMKEAEDEKTKNLLDARQESLKVLSNSFYGYLGFSAARWYSIESALSVTAYGRHYIKGVIEKAEKSGFSVLYSDTDSVFLALNKKTKEDALKFKDSVNMELTELMELDYEEIYPAGLFVAAKGKAYGAKKKYALLSKEGFIKIKGFETVRRNWSQIAKEAQQNVLKIILEEGDAKKAIAYVRKIVDDLKSKKIPVEKAVMKTQLTKHIGEYENVGPHVAVAQRMKESGADVMPGTMIRWVVVSGTGKIRDRSKHIDELKKDESYDADYYIDNQVIPSVEGILAVFGYSKEDIIADKTQSSLKGFIKK